MRAPFFTASPSATVSATRRPADLKAISTSVSSILPEILRTFASLPPQPSHQTTERISRRNNVPAAMCRLSSWGIRFPMGTKLITFKPELMQRDPGVHFRSKKQERILRFRPRRPLARYGRFHSRRGVSDESLQHSLDIALMQVLVARIGENLDGNSSKQGPGSRADGEVHPPYNFLFAKTWKRLLEGR